MEERRTAAIVLSILALITIFFTVVLPFIRSKQTQTLIFRGCKVQYKYSKEVPGDDLDRAENNKFALCLCGLYMQKPDTSVGNKILSIYRQYDKGTNTTDGLEYDKNLNSLIKNRKALLDTLISID
jgi:hypothetical protein